MTVLTGQQAALALVGELPTTDPATLRKAEPMLAMLKRAYEDTRQWLIDALMDSEEPPGMLVSEEMAKARSRELPDDLAAVAGGDWRVQCFLHSPDADFERQHFRRETIDRWAKWLRETGRPSKHGFQAPGQDAPEIQPADTTPQATAMSASTADGLEPLKSEPEPKPADTQPQAANPETAQAPPESTDERCARRLLWFEEEEEEEKKKRGALARVAKRDGHVRQTVKADIKRALKQRQDAAGPFGAIAKNLTR
jgi:hypothetical protein